MSLKLLFSLKDDSIQLTAMLWLKELVNLLGDRALYFMPGILGVILPCFAFNDEAIKKNIKELSRSINLTLWSMIEKSNAILTMAADAALSQKQAAEKVNDESSKDQQQQKQFAIDKVIESLLRFMNTPSDSISVVSTIESLKWILHLVNKQPSIVSLVKTSFF